MKAKQKRIVEGEGHRVNGQYEIGDFVEFFFRYKLFIFLLH